jgi:hypothetical protein
MRAVRRGIVLAALAGLVLAVFWQVGGHHFLMRDDGIYVSGNPHVQGGLNPANVLWAFTSLEGGNWNPLTWLSHQADVEFFGSDPGAHHLSSLLIQLVSTLLLCVVLHGMTGSLWPAAVTAALFGIHPLHVESVAWVAERKDVLSGLSRRETIAPPPTTTAGGLFA